MGRTEAKRLLGDLVRVSAADRRMFIVAVVFSTAIFSLDLLVPLGVAAGIPYILPVLICVRAKNPRLVYSLAILGSVLITAGYYLSPASGTLWIVLANRILTLGSIWAVAFLAERLLTRTIEHQKVESKERATQARLSEILAIAPEAIITIDRQNKILFFNKGAELTFGYSPEEITGCDLKMLMPERFHGAHGDHVKGFLNSSRVHRLMDQRSEITGLRKDSTEFPAAASVSKLANGKDTIFTVILHDVSERKRVEEDRLKALDEAEQASEAKSKFLASMSHELRTPLNAIIGFSEVMSLQFLGPLGTEKYEEYVKDIRNSARYLLSLINDILDISAIEAGSHQLDKEYLQISDIVDESIKTVKIEAAKARISLAMDMPDELTSIYADRRAVHQILINLLSNSIKFTPPGGRITVSCEATPKEITVIVTDTGEGIPPEKIKGLTLAFHRGETDPHKTATGWGLGLAITKALVGLHNGELSIESEVGVGTSVSVSLPGRGDLRALSQPKNMAPPGG